MLPVRQDHPVVGHAVKVRTAVRIVPDRDEWRVDFRDGGWWKLWTTWGYYPTFGMAALGAPLAFTAGRRLPQ